MQSWDTTVEGRDTLAWQVGSHSLKMGAGCQRFIWPMWAYVLSRRYYQFTSGYTTQTATNDGTGSALASMELGLPAVRQRQVGSPRMNLRQWYANSFIQDTWRLNATTTLNLSLRYEFMSPLTDISNQWAGLFVTPTTLTAYIGGQLGTLKGLFYPNKLNFAPRLGLAKQFTDSKMVFRSTYGIFYTPVDMNTWCNNLRNVPIIFPETNQSDVFTPSITSLNFGPAIVGQTVTSFTAFDPHQPAQYVQQWTASLERTLGSQTVIEVGYQGDRGLHLQRAHLINVSTVTWLENTERSWYDVGYVNVRRRYSGGLSLLANYTYSKNLTNAPDFRSPMFEAAILHDNNDLNAEKGPGCDIRHRLAASVVYDIPALNQFAWPRGLSRNWQLSGTYAVSAHPHDPRERTKELGESSGLWETVAGRDSNVLS